MSLTPPDGAMGLPEPDPELPTGGDASLGDVAPRAVDACPSSPVLVAHEPRLPTRPIIAQSWRRCAASRTARLGNLPPVPLQTPELDGYRQAHPLGVMLPTCRDLLGDAVREAGCVFALGDARGALLWVEGDPETRRRIERINFVEGAIWSEDVAGTNAPGTALQVGGPVQIHGEEHFNEAVRAWSCAASPIRDEDSGRLIGVLDVTGGEVAAGPQMLALARATARAIEAELARQVAMRDARARAACGRSVLPPDAAALVSPGGRILAANTNLGLTRIPGLIDSGDGSGLLPDGRRLMLEPVGVSGYVIVRFVDGGTGDGPRAALRLSVLGRDGGVVELDGRSIRLGPRHSEIMVLLARAKDGLSAAELAAGLSEGELRTTNLRVDMSRLRSLLGENLLGSRPYLLHRAVRTDMDVVQELLAHGRIPDAFAVYPGPLLPHSVAPGVVRLRHQLHDALRAAVVGSYDTRMLQMWLEAPWGRDDADAWEALARLQPEGSERRLASAERARTLRS